jgi:hypothetical protein
MSEDETKLARHARKNEARAARYRKSQAAQKEVGRRLLLALDRLGRTWDEFPR